MAELPEFLRSKSSRTKRRRIRDNVQKAIVGICKLNDSVHSTRPPDDTVGSAGPVECDSETPLAAYDAADNNVMIQCAVIPDQAQSEDNDNIFTDNSVTQGELVINESPSSMSESSGKSDSDLDESNDNRLGCEILD